ncbi:MAG: hypothetical protein OSA92_06245 [Pirellulaceae bacterium]|nr:hypothetical protein [Pirellulaceae bacterium]
MTASSKQHAVDQDGEVIDAFLQARRDGAAAKRYAGTITSTNLSKSVRM